MAILFCLAEQNQLGSFGRRPYEEICDFYYYFRQVVQEMLYRNTSYLQLWWADHSGNFDRGHYKEHSYEIILNLDPRDAFLTTALVAILFGRVEIFRQFC